MKECLCDEIGKHDALLEQQLSAQPVQGLQSVADALTIEV
jgi:hypothetical protein